ncbi:TPA: DUF1642 domain-containing protein [Enterococcus faecium]
MNKQEPIKKLESIKAIGNDAIAACYNESMNAGITLMKKIDEPKKLVIPQLVAGWLEKSTDPFTKAEKIAYLIKSKDGDSYYFCDWFVRDGIVTQEQGEELLAWTTRQSYETLLSLYNGYEVEKEPVWAIKNAQGNYLTKCDLWGKDGVNYSFECNPSDKLLFTDKLIADAAALLVKGTAEQENK